MKGVEGFDCVNPKLKGSPVASKGRFKNSKVEIGIKHVGGLGNGMTFVINGTGNRGAGLKIRTGFNTDEILCCVVVLAVFQTLGL